MIILKKPFSPKSKVTFLVRIQKCKAQEGI